MCDESLTICVTLCCITFCIGVRVRHRRVKQRCINLPSNKYAIRISRGM